MLVTDCHCCVIEDTWKDIAAIAWAGYLNSDRGIVRVDTTQPGSIAHRPLMFYQPLAACLDGEEIDLIRGYDPNKEAIVCIVDEHGRHTCRACHLELTPPVAYARAGQLGQGLVV